MRGEEGKVDRKDTIAIKGEKGKHSNTQFDTDQKHSKRERERERERVRERDRQTDRQRDREVHVNEHQWTD